MKRNFVYNFLIQKDFLNTHSKGDFCLRMREKLFYFYPFVNALREAWFSVLSNLTTEPLKENHCLIGPQ